MHRVSVCARRIQRLSSALQSASSVVEPVASVTTSAVRCEQSGGDKKGRGERRRNRKPKPAWNPFKAEDVNVNSPWSSVYQEPRPFDPYIVAMPIRMGRAEKGSVPPPALGNLELMKIPNFFHLTPPAIQKHCEALKPLCTPWPERLPRMPISIETRNYVLTGRSLRHSGARKVVLTCRLKDLTLSDRARDKLIQLAGERYDPDTDRIRLVGKRCMTRKQNRDYVMYLLKVLYLESNRIEPWEQEDSVQ